MATNWHIGLDNAANKKFVGTFRAKYNRDPATFAALGYDAVKAIDAAVRGVNGAIENKDALRASMRTEVHTGGYIDDSPDPACGIRPPS